MDSRVEETFFLVFFLGDFLEDSISTFLLLLQPKLAIFLVWMITQCGYSTKIGKKIKNKNKTRP
jgi:hypothetical protein